MLKAFAEAADDLDSWSDTEAGKLKPTASKKQKDKLELRRPCSHWKGGCEMTAFGKNFQKFEEKVELKRVLVMLFYNMQFTALKMYKTALTVVKLKAKRCCGENKMQGERKGRSPTWYYGTECCQKAKQLSGATVGSSLKFGAKVLLQLCRSTNKHSYDDDFDDDISKRDDDAGTGSKASSGRLEGFFC